MVAQDLRQAAMMASQAAYVPYSHFSVGASLMTRQGLVYTGCNIENASFGLTNCAERTAIFKAVSEGHRDITSLVVYGHTKEPISPCGACRQVMAEFMAPEASVTLLATDGRAIETTVAQLLPHAFTDLS